MPITPTHQEIGIQDNIAGLKTMKKHRIKHLLIWVLLISLKSNHVCASTSTPGTGAPALEGDLEGESEGEYNGTMLESRTAEPKGGTVVGVVLVVTLYSLIIIIILVGNILVALTIMRSKTLRANTSNLYLLSLVTARASIAVFVIPARITGMFSEQYLGSVLCKLCHFAAMGSSTASIFSVVSIAISKYIQVTDVKARALTMKESGLVIVLIWVLGFAYAIREAIVNDLVIVNTATSSMWSCTTSPVHKHLNKYFIFVDMTCLFLVPLVIILFCYSRVIKSISKRTMSDKGTEILTMDKQSYKAMQMLLILMILFTICTSSPMILNLYILWDGKLFDSFYIIATFVYMFSYSNSWFNLIVFAYFRKDLRQAFVNMCCHKGTVTLMGVKAIGGMSEDQAKKDTALRMMEF